MIFFDQELQEKYAQADPLRLSLEGAAEAGDDRFTTHRWLLDSLPKRMIFQELYGDLLRNGQAPRTILDVGGGFSSVSRELIKHQRYTLLDIMAHDPHEQVAALEKASPYRFWENNDWYRFNPANTYDVVVANDLFTNVDQRLKLFIEKYLPVCREMRLSITYYNEPRFYQVKRTDADEIFFMLAWDGWQVRRVLEAYKDKIEQPRLEKLTENFPSLFKNNRLVCTVKLRGGAA